MKMLILKGSVRRRIERIRVMTCLFISRMFEKNVSLNVLEGEVESG